MYLVLLYRQTEVDVMFHFGVLEHVSVNEVCIYSKMCHFGSIDNC